VAKNGVWDGGWGRVSRGGENISSFVESNAPKKMGRMTRVVVRRIVGYVIVFVHKNDVN
jgi:hypothetical protein